MTFSKGNPVELKARASSHSAESLVDLNTNPAIFGHCPEIPRADKVPNRGGRLAVGSRVICRTSTSELIARTNDAIFRETKTTPDIA